MTRPICAYPEHHQEHVVHRRLKNQTGGLGFLAAQDAQRHLDTAERQRHAQAHLEPVDDEEIAA